jgi:hypothetical protein
LHWEPFIWTYAAIATESTAEFGRSEIVPISINYQAGILHDMRVETSTGTTYTIQRIINAQELNVVLTLCASRSSTTTRRGSVSEPDRSENIETSSGLVSVAREPDCFAIWNNVPAATAAPSEHLIPRFAISVRVDSLLVALENAAESFNCLPAGGSRVRADCL